MINTTQVKDLNQTTLYKLINKFSTYNAYEQNTYNKFQNYTFAELEDDILTSAEDYYQMGKFTEQDMIEINELLVSLRES